MGGKQFLMISQPTASSEDEIGEIHIVGHENNSMNDIALCSSWLVAGSQVVIARTLGTSEYRGGGGGGDGGGVHLIQL